MSGFKSNRGQDRDQNGTSGGEQGGSFWTSYSDMLLGLSVIFLVLFFFTVLRTGVDQGQVKKAKQDAQKALEGKVSPSEVARAQETETFLKNSIQEITQKKEVLDQSATEITRTLKLLDEQSKAVSDLLKQQQEKSAIVNVLRDKTETLEGQLSSIEQRREELEKRLADRELSMENVSQELRVLNQERSELFARMRGMQDELKQRDIALLERSQILDEKSKTLQALEGQLQAERTKLEKTREELSAWKTEGGNLSKRTSELERLSDAQNKEGQKLREEKMALSERVADLQGEVAGLRTQLSGLGRSNELLQKDQQASGEGRAKLAASLMKTELERDGLQAELRGLKKELESARGDQGKTLAKVSRCEEKLAELDQKQNRTPSSLSDLSRQMQEARADLEALRSKRRDFAKELSRELKSQGIQAQVNPQSGSLVFEMDETFRFQNGSAQLTAEAKLKLNQIVPIYVARLFSQEKKDAAVRLKQVDITGFASPRYFKKYLPPSELMGDGAVANLKLSQDRAQQIAEYIVGKEIGDYPHKADLKRLMRISGVGHTQPIRAPASFVQSEPCGPYDCARSRRVELNFILMGERDSLPHPARE